MRTTRLGAEPRRLHSCPTATEERRSDEICSWPCRGNAACRTGLAAIMIACNHDRRRWRAPGHNQTLLI